MVFFRWLHRLDKLEGGHFSDRFSSGFIHFMASMASELMRPQGCGRTLSFAFFGVGAFGLNQRIEERNPNKSQNPQIRRRFKNVSRV